MFEIERGENGEIMFVGRLDAAQAEKAQSFLDSVEAPSVLDFARLEYISSAGLGSLLRTQKRLMASGGCLRLINVNEHIGNVFRFSGFDKIFEIESAGA
jgi:anti-sigma B factor antagonist